jgi:hypothetical protein
MRPWTSLKRTSFIIWCLLAYSSVLSGQTYSFRNYGAESNIPDRVIYSLNQSDDGFLWVGAGAGLYRFDGFDFYNVQYPDSVSERHPTASLKDRNGRLWFGFDDGTVFYTLGHKLFTVPLPDSTATISNILEGPEGRIWIVPQKDAIFSANALKPADVIRYSFTSDDPMLSGAFTSDGDMLIVTQLNILVCKLGNKSISVVRAIEGVDNSSLRLIYPYGDKSQWKWIFQA